MKTLIRVLALLVLASAISQAKEYSLDEIVTLGMENDGQIQKVQEEINKVDAQIWEAYGSALPKIDASANYQYAFDQYNPYAGGGTSSMAGFSAIQMLQDSGVSPVAEPGAYLVGGAVDGLTMGLASMIPDMKKQTAAWSISLQQPVFAQGKVGIGLKIAKHYKKGLEQKHQHVSDSVRAQIIKLFYGNLLAQKNRAIQREGLTHATESHRLAVLRCTIGNGSELDTLSSRLSLEKARIDLQSAETGQILATEALLKQVGINESVDEFRLAGDFPEEDFQIAQEEALDRMKAKSRILQQLQSGEEVQKQLIRLARSDFYPMVYCGGSIGQISQFNSGETLEWYDDRKVFVGATINLFSGFGNIQRIKQARADYRSYEQTKKQAEDGLELGLKSLVYKLETGRRNLAQTRALVQLAEKGYKVSRSAYEVGARTLLDLQKAETDLQGAKMALNASQFEFYSTVVDLKLLIGQPLTE